MNKEQLTDTIIKTGMALNAMLLYPSIEIQGRSFEKDANNEFDEKIVELKNKLDTYLKSK